MNKDLGRIFDECLDKINSGESVEDCLKQYPQYANELEPLLAAVLDLHEINLAVADKTAEEASMQRLYAAIDFTKKQKHKSRLTFWGFWRHIFSRKDKQETKLRRLIMRKGLAITTAAIVVVGAIVAVSILRAGPSGGPGNGQTIAGNFQFLISDEVIAITDFSKLELSIDKIGLQKGGESGSWTELEPAVSTVDLVELQGLNATEIWSGDIDPGQYTKVFIYVDGVTAILKTGETTDIFLPSGKIQMSVPFVIAEDGTVEAESPVSFVYDITVLKAGQSGQYLLQPQVEESGVTQSFHEIGEGDLNIQLEGLLEPGETATVYVTHEGNPVEGATVEVNDEVLDGLTDAAGMITFVTPDDDEIEIKAELDDLEGELEIDMEREDKIKEKKEKEKDEDLTVVAVGDVIPGQSMTIRVSNAAGPVEGAYVEVNDEELDDQTDAEGSISFIAPQEEEIEIKAFHGDNEGELEIELGEDLDLELSGELIAGEDVTLTATFQGTATEGAAVTVNDEVLTETTDENGQVTFTIPVGAEEIEIEAVKGDLEGELEINIGGEISGDLMIQLQGAITSGEDVTVRVSIDGIPIQGATVTVNEVEVEDVTNENGEISFEVPDATVIQIEAELGELEGELEIEMEEEEEEEE